MKKTVKIKFVGMYSSFEWEGNYIIDVIKKFYDLQICEKSEDADYIFCSCFDFYEFCKYPQVRIMFSGEPYIPDFNYIDYAISVFPLEYKGRHLSLPGFMGHKEYFETVNRRENDKSVLKSKTQFANFIFGHELPDGMRAKLFNKLSEYKRVDASGAYLNNMPNGEVATYFGTKNDFQKKTKFSIIVEGSYNNGYLSEKIWDAFRANTIPIFYGSDSVNNVFNKNAFINCSDYNSLDEVLEVVKALDNDDDAYLKMLNQPIFNDENYVVNKEKELDNFIKYIFEQPLDKAYRRERGNMTKIYSEYLIYTSAPDKFRKKIKNDEKQKNKIQRKRNVKLRLKQLKNEKRYFRCFLTWVKYFWYLYLT